MKKEPNKRGFFWLIATWFGTGQSPVISGTVGSLAALPFAYFILLHCGAFGLLAAAILIFFIGIWASNHYLRIYGGEDPGEIVVDEVAGQWLLLTIVPLGWKYYAVGFILFRIFDIWKPWPVSWADSKIKGGLGVMLDDILAAFYGMAVYLLLEQTGFLHF